MSPSQSHIKGALVIFVPCTTLTTATDKLLCSVRSTCTMLLHKLIIYFHGSSPTPGSDGISHPQYSSSFPVDISGYIFFNRLSHFLSASLLKLLNM